MVQKAAAADVDAKAKCESLLLSSTMGTLQFFHANVTGIKGNAPKQIT